MSHIPIYRLALIILMLSLLLAAPSFAQSVVDEVLAEVAEELEEDGALSDDVSEELANLRSLADNPIDLSNASEDELAQLVFLSPSAIRSILWHRDHAGGVLTDDELLTIAGLSYGDLFRLSQFARPGGPRHANGPSALKLNSLARIQRSAPLARGYSADSAGVAPFAGPPIKCLVRMTGELGNTWKAAAILENDAGEPAFHSGTSLTDFASAYLAYQDRSRLLRKVVVGHYDLRLGQGLGIWTGFSFNPALARVSRDRCATGFSGRSSAAESRFLRGLAAEFGRRHLRLTLFGSATDADVTTQQYDGHTVMSTIRTAGLHRTATERLSRHNDLIAQWGAYARFAPSIFQLGLGANTWHSRIPLSRLGEPRRAHQPEGNSLTTLHADHHVYLHHATLYGELAAQTNSTSPAWAVVQGVDVDLREGCSLSANVRHFSPGFYSVAQQPLCESPYANGESGFSLDFQCLPFRRLSLRASADVFRLSWLRYQVWQPTSGWRFRLWADCPLSHRSRLSFRIRSSAREATLSNGVTRAHLAQKRQTSLKTILSLEPNPRLSLHSLAEGTLVHSLSDESSHGLLVCQDVRLTSPRETVSLSASASLFSTTSYDARVFTRQPNVLYDMSFPSLYGRGVNLCSMLKVVPLNQLRLWLWCSSTFWTDRQSVGSGPDATDSPHRTTLKLQVQWKLFHSRS